MPPVLDPSKSKVDGLAFLGLSLTRASEYGHPESQTHQTAFDWNEVLDRDYQYLFSTNDDGWLVGGGEPGPPRSYKLAAPDSAHVELLRIGTYRPEWGGLAVQDVIQAIQSGHILIPQIEVLPTAVVANGDVPPELEIRFDMEPNTTRLLPTRQTRDYAMTTTVAAAAAGPSGDYLYVGDVEEVDDVKPTAENEEDDPLPVNWQLRFLHNQLFQYFSYPSRFCPGAFHSTILRKAEFRSPQHREEYFDKCDRAVRVWRQRGPQPLVPPHFDDLERQNIQVIRGETYSPEYQSGLWLFTDRNTITHHFAPNFLPPYTGAKRRLILQALSNEWDEQTLNWIPCHVPIVTKNETDEEEEEETINILVELENVDAPDDEQQLGLSIAESRSMHTPYMILSQEEEPAQREPRTGYGSRPDPRDIDEIVLLARTAQSMEEHGRMEHVSTMMHTPLTSQEERWDEVEEDNEIEEKKIEHLHEYQHQASHEANQAEAVTMPHDEIEALVPSDSVDPIILVAASSIGPAACDDIETKESNSSPPLSKDIPKDSDEVHEVESPKLPKIYSEYEDSSQPEVSETPYTWVSGEHPSEEESSPPMSTKSSEERDQREKNALQPESEHIAIPDVNSPVTPAAAPGIDCSDTKFFTSDEAKNDMKEESSVSNSEKHDRFQEQQEEEESQAMEFPVEEIDEPPMAPDEPAPAVQIEDKKHNEQTLSTDHPFPLAQGQYEEISSVVGACQDELRLPVAMEESPGPVDETNDLLRISMAQDTTKASPSSAHEETFQERFVNTLDSGLLDFKDAKENSPRESILDKQDVDEPKNDDGEDAFEDPTMHSVDSDNGDFTDALEEVENFVSNFANSPKGDVPINCEHSERIEAPGKQMLNDSAGNATTSKQTDEKTIECVSAIPNMDEMATILEVGDEENSTTSEPAALDSIDSDPIVKLKTFDDVQVQKSCSATADLVQFSHDENYLSPPSSKRHADVVPSESHHSERSLRSTMSSEEWEKAHMHLFAQFGSARSEAESPTAAPGEVNLRDLLEKTTKAEEKKDEEDGADVMSDYVQRQQNACGDCGVGNIFDVFLNRS